MDYVKPQEVAETMAAVGAAKARLAVRDLAIRGVLAGALLGFATSLAQTASIQAGAPLVGALVFPVGFILIVLLGMELVTGNFAVVPVGRISGGVSTALVLRNFFWVTLGNLAGSVLYAALLWATLTDATPGPLAQKLVALAEAKTTGYQRLGEAGMAAVFVKAVLCNWMVTVGVVAPMATSSTIGKIAAAWMPIFIFFAQGFEHLVVNFFLIPAGMMLGAKVTVAQAVLWNFLPVLIGNFLGGFVFTGAAIYLTHGKRTVRAPHSQMEGAPMGAQTER